MSLPSYLHAKSAADIQRGHPDAMHVKGWIADGFGRAASIQGAGPQFPPVVSTTTYQPAPLLEFSALDQESVSVLAHALMGLEWRGSEADIIFSACPSAHAKRRITPNPSTDGTMRAGPRAVVTVRRESARAIPTFRKKPRLRRVQRCRLNGPVSQPVPEPALLASNRCNGTRYRSSYLRPHHYCKQKAR
jgi:hypothetical protein